MSIIKVKGTGRVKVKPDYMLVRIRLESIARDYQEAYDAMIEQHTALIDVFRVLKLNRSLIRLSSISSHVNDRDTEHRRVIVGQDLVYKDRIDIEQCRQLLHELRQVTDFAIDVHFYLKDDSRAQEEALVKAVNNATDKAKVIVGASGLKLGSVVNMTTAMAEQVMYPRMMSAAESETAKDIEVGQAVEIEWEIDKK